MAPKDGEVRHPLSGRAGHSFHLPKNGEPGKTFHTGPWEGAGPPPSTPVSSSTWLVACQVPAYLAQWSPGAGHLAMPRCLVAFLIVLILVVWILHMRLWSFPVRMASPPDCCRVKSEYLCVTLDSLPPPPQFHTPPCSCCSLQGECASAARQSRSSSRALVRRYFPCEACVSMCSCTIRCFLLRIPRNPVVARVTRCHSLQCSSLSAHSLPELRRTKAMLDSLGPYRVLSWTREWVSVCGH